MAENNIAGFKKLIRYAQNLAEYEQGIAEGIIDENVFVIVLDEKVAKFKGLTFDWSPLDISSLATKAEVIENEEVHAAALNDLNDRIGAIEENVSGSTVSKEEFESTVTTITESVAGKADTTYVNTELGKKADTTYVDEKFGSIDFSTLATKEEVQNLTNEIIDNEEVHAAALNDLEERKADKDYVEQYVEDAITSAIASAITTALNTEV